MRALHDHLHVQPPCGWAEGEEAAAGESCAASAGPCWVAMALVHGQEVPECAGTIAAQVWVGLVVSTRACPEVVAV